MPRYDYICEDKGCPTLHLPPYEPMSVELIRVKEDRDEKVLCPKCVSRMSRVPSVCSWSFGWVLSDASQEAFGPKNEYVKNV